MDVIFIPYNEYNPYQPRLSECLAEEGMLVTGRIRIGDLVSQLIRKRETVDVIHLHWLPHLEDGNAGIRQARLYAFRLFLLTLLGKKIVWTVHNLYSHESERKSLEKWLVGKVVKRASKIIVHAETSKQLVTDEFGVGCEEKISVIPHGNYLGCYPNTLSREESRQRLNLPAASKVFLFFGHIRPYKGIHQLLAAFQRLIDPEAVLLIAGEPLNNEMADEIRELASSDSRIKLRLESVPDEEAQVLMNACDAVVFPYQQILTSGAVIMAMSFGKACLAPRIGSIPETVIDGKGGILYGPDEEEGLLLSLEKASKISSDEFSQMGRFNLAIAKKLDWEGIARKTAAIYQEALNQ